MIGYTHTRSILTTLASVCSLSPAVATPFIISELEPNGTPGSAQAVASGRVFDLTLQSLASLTDFEELSASRIHGTITPGDVDYFSINLVNGFSTFLDIRITDGVPADFQLLAIDGGTGRVIDFSAASAGPSNPFVQLAFDGFELSGTTVIFAVSGGRDLDPSLTNPVGFAVGSPLTGELAAFDGLEFDSGLPHAASFEYQLTFTPGFVPTPAAAMAFAVAGAVAARRRTR